MRNPSFQTWLARIFIGMVLFFNVQCAIVFLVFPDTYTAGFELEGAVGIGFVQAMGLLFLMWNVPYAVALADPIRHKISLYESVIMQAIGFVGELMLAIGFHGHHPVIQATISRFMLFDGVGLVALLISAWITHRPMVRNHHGDEPNP